MPSNLMALDESYFEKSYIHKYVESLTWFIALATCYFYWWRGNEEITTDFNVAHQAVFFLSSGVFFYLQREVNRVVVGERRKAQYLAIAANLLFLLLAHFFCYYMFGIAFLCLISMNVRLFHRYFVWCFSLSLPFISGLYDVSFKALPFYLETKCLFFALNLLMLTFCERTRLERMAQYKAHRLIEELNVTRWMLEQSAKSNERLRISRDLHDSAGHYLTAMNVQLEVAMLSRGDALQENLKAAKHLGGKLYQELRQSVQEYRVSNRQDLEQSIMTLTQNSVGLKVETALELDKEVIATHCAEIVYRCIQESLTNTLRHSNASCAKIVVTMVSGVTHIEYHDNGTKNTELVMGNGLTGLRERLESIDGRLNVELTEKGFALKAQFEESSARL